MNALYHKTALSLKQKNGCLIPLFDGILFVVRADRFVSGRAPGEIF